MAQLSWPLLEELAFHGRCCDSGDVAQLGNICRRASKLSKLSLTLAPPNGGSRLQVFGAQTTSNFSIHLRSLAIAYPDPNDSLFDSVGPDLTNLSIIDYPRLYYRPSSPVVAGYWAAPILSSDECLSIIKRMSLMLLTSLALAYVWDEAEEEAREGGGEIEGNLLRKPE